jgi:hypothetical protein
VMEGGSYGQVGAYGLLLNFGNQSQPQIPPPNTVVASQPNGDGGSTDNAFTATNGDTSNPAGDIGLGASGAVWTTIGDLAGWAAAYTTAAGTTGTATGGGTPASPVVPPNSSPVVVGPVAAPVAVVSVTSAAPVAIGANPTPSSQGSTSPAPSPSLSSTPHHHKHVHHAVDATLSAWTGHRRQPRKGARVRHDGHKPVTS